MKVRKRIGCDPEFRRRLEMAFQDESVEPSREASSSTENRHSPEGADADPAGVANILRDAMSPLVSAISALKDGQELPRARRLAPEAHNPLLDVTTTLREIVVPLVSAIVSSRTNQEALRPEQRPQPRSQRQAPSPGEQKYCEARLLAERLVKWSMPGPNGTVKVMTTAEIERHVAVTLKVSRNSALSAATKAVKRLDPDNPARRSHKPPVARAVTPETVAHMRNLRAQGFKLTEVARIIGCDVRTVRSIQPR
jgi:hypothetical protein